MNLSQKIESIVTDTLELYRDNFQLFISLGFLTALPGFLFLIFIKPNFYSFSISLIITLTLAIPVYYFAIRFSIALLLAVRSRAEGKEITVSQSFTKAKKHFWKYFWTNLKLGLIAVSPFLFILFITAIAPIQGLIVILTIIFGFAIILFLLFNGFAPLVSIFRPEKDSYFNYSQELVNSNFFLVFSMVALSALLEFFIYLICEYLLAPIGIYHGFGGQIVDFIFNVFSIPIFSGGFVLLFFMMLSEVEPRDDDQTQITGTEHSVE